MEAFLPPTRARSPRPTASKDRTYSLNAFFPCTLSGVLSTISSHGTLPAATAGQRREAGEGGAADRVLRFRPEPRPRPQPPAQTADPDSLRPAFVRHDSRPL